MRLPRVFLAVAMTLSACQPTIPRDALQLSQESLELRQLQTRRFDSPNETSLLVASANVLQDLGFTLDESETGLGVVVGSKRRDATEAGQVVGAIVVAALLGVAMPIDQNQTIRASLVTRPISEAETAVRVTFQRIVWNNQNQVSRVEALTDASLYQQFFDRLSQSVFLTAHQI